MYAPISTNGHTGHPVGTVLAAPRDEQKSALPERSGEASANGAPDGPTGAAAPAAPSGMGTRHARGPFTRGNPGWP
jgi:hypothetical protein